MARFPALFSPHSNRWSSLLANREPVSRDRTGALVNDVRREQWASKLGFLAAAVGSAVGLGNMWRFSYLTAENGGAAFVILYVVMVFVVALPVLLAELMLGRGSRRSPIQALLYYGGGPWQPLGALFVLSGFTILAYYSVIAGWALRYAVEALLGGFWGEPAARFAAMSEGTGAIAWHLIFMAGTIAIVAGGVQKGIERTTLIAMPVLFLVLCALAIYAATLDNGAGGYAYYLQTDFREIFSRVVLTEAAGQAFFSLSLGMGTMLTYASYLSREHHLPNESLTIASVDFLIAFIAGLVVFPLIFALGLAAQVGESTVGALFITLPEAFARMGIAGRPVGVLFFSALLVGALTSAISLLEVIVASAVDAWGWSRKTSSLVLGTIVALCGVPAALSIEVLSVMDAVANNVFLIAGGLALSIFVGWKMGDPIAEVGAGASGARWFLLWPLLLRFVVPVVLVFVLIDSIPRTLTAIVDLFR